VRGSRGEIAAAKLPVLGQRVLLTCPLVRVAPRCDVCRAREQQTNGRLAPRGEELHVGHAVRAVRRKYANGLQTPGRHTPAVLRGASA
jgi:hypothetical protein